MMSQKVNNLIIYDQECNYCSTSAKTASKLADRNTKIASYQDSKIQDFLSKQFEEVPFTLLFVDMENNTISAGDDAVEDINSSSVNSKALERIFSGKYEAISSFISVLTGRGKEVDLTEGRFDIEKEAKEELLDYIDKKTT